MSRVPNSDVRAVILDNCDEVWARFRARLAGLTREEYLWEPAPGCWSVRSTTDGAGVDGEPGDEPDPAPVTTIAWRMWHIAIDCLDSYSVREFGSAGGSVDGTTWHLEPEPAIADLDASWAAFRSGAAAREADAWMQPLGERWGPFADSTFAHLVLHALDEVTHHAAEVALLRDLHRSSC